MRVIINPNHDLLIHAVTGRLPAPRHDSRSREFVGPGRRTSTSWTASYQMINNELLIGRMFLAPLQAPGNIWWRPPSHFVSSDQRSDLILSSSPDSCTKCLSSMHVGVIGSPVRHCIMNNAYSTGLAPPRVVGRTPMAFDALVQKRTSDRHYRVVHSTSLLRTMSRK